VEGGQRREATGFLLGAIVQLCDWTKNTYHKINLFFCAEDESQGLTHVRQALDLLAAPLAPRFTFKKDGA
jgi:hypothetical protein